MKTHPCIICGTPVECMEYDNEDDRRGLHPMDGTEFFTYGHYGSTVFDPMNGSSMHIVICNTCLTHRQQAALIEEPK